MADPTMPARPSTMKRRNSEDKMKAMMGDEAGMAAHISQTVGEAVRSPHARSDHIVWDSRSPLDPCHRMAGREG
jgi:hypothetical protein